ncbi:MurR/RpiR family transcriptional regulator [Dactylosporangium maewongense]|uniref:MurR/RpiR family transcriptional regulator n=1 Tax=Dactylosporangium maewongense TaxID=634393 RepID=A0ABN2DIM4_9ACTN
MGRFDTDSHVPQDEHGELNPQPSGEVLPTDGSDVAGLSGWLESRTPREGLSAKVAKVVQVLTTHPRSASYIGAAEVAERAGVNIATVTRTAQKLGFAGWPALQQELRARFLLSLSLPEVAAAHGQLTGSPATASVQQDLDALVVLSRAQDVEVFSSVVHAIAHSRQTLVVALGSYAAVGKALAHNVRLMGYPALLLDEPTTMANTLAGVGPGDVVVAVSFWRMYRSTVQAAELARAREATVCAITDTISSPLAAYAHHLLLTPAESVSFFPSLTAGVSVAQALCAELASLDPERTRRTIATAEETWDYFGLMDRPRGRRLDET